MVFSVSRTRMANGTGRAERRPVVAERRIFLSRRRIAVIGARLIAPTRLRNLLACLHFWSRGVQASARPDQQQGGSPLTRCSGRAKAALAQSGLLGHATGVCRVDQQGFQYGANAL